MALLRAERAPEYSPRRIGLSQPQSGKTYEFFVMGKNDRNLNLEVHKILTKHKTQLIMQTGYADDSTNHFVLNFCCDMTKADCSPDELLLELRRVPNVIRADKKFMKNMLFESFLSPLTVIDKFRTVVIGIDPLIKIEKRLNDLFGVQGTSLMYEEGRAYAIDLVRQHREVISSHMSASAEVVLQNVQAGLKAMGWGAFDIRLEGEMANAFISDLPPGISPELVDTSNCTFVYGIVAGIIEALFGFDMNVRNVTYDKNGNVLRLVFSPRESQDENVGVLEKNYLSSDSKIADETSEPPQPEEEFISKVIFESDPISPKENFDVEIRQKEHEETPKSEQRPQETERKAKSKREQKEELAQIEEKQETEKKDEKESRPSEQIKEEKKEIPATEKKSDPKPAPAAEKKEPAKVEEPEPESAESEETEYPPDRFSEELETGQEIFDF